MEENREVVEEAINLPGIEEIFPALDKIPKSISTKFQEMIHCYLETVKKSPDLEKVRGFQRLGEIFDNQGELFCYFKTSENAKIEAAVYILDHPFSSHRSTSEDLFGYGGAPPTVYIRTKTTSGSLILHVKNDGVVGKISVLQLNTPTQDINKLCIFHLRFGNADCHNRNTLAKKDADEIYRLTPIDFEECFTAKYILRRIWWEDTKMALEHKAFTDDMVKYVNGIQVDRDINFLRSCGWDVPSHITNPFKIFNFFVKESLRLELTALDMVSLVRESYNTRGFNLCEMVQKAERFKAQGEEVFIEKVFENIQAGLTKYARKFPRKSQGN